MIAKQVKGSGFRGTISYVLSKERAELINSNMLGENIDDLSREFGQARKLRPNLKKCVYHASLSLPESETLSDQKWKEVSNKYMNKMGFSGSQFVAVKHTDTAHQHIHIVASRIRLDGTVVSDSQDYKRSEKLIRGFEREYGLKQVLPSREIGLSAPTSGELRKALRNNDPSIKMQLQEIIGNATKEKQSMTGFIEKLESNGVGVMANISEKTGHISGISFVLDGEVMKGSDLGKSFTWNGLKRKGINYEYDSESKIVIEAKRRCITNGIRETVGKDGPHSGRGYEKNGRTGKFNYSQSGKNNGGYDSQDGTEKRLDSGRTGKNINPILESLFNDKGDRNIVEKDKKRYPKKFSNRDIDNFFSFTSYKPDSILLRAREILRDSGRRRKVEELSEKNLASNAQKRSGADFELCQKLDRFLRPYDQLVAKREKELEQEKMEKVRNRERSRGFSIDF